jgi:hypothetical protein
LEVLSNERMPLVSSHASPHPPISRFAMLVVGLFGLMVLVDLREAVRLRSALRQMAQQSASAPKLRLHSFYLPGRGHNRLITPSQPGAEPSRDQNQPGMIQPSPGETL